MRYGAYKCATILEELVKLSNGYQDFFNDYAKAFVKIPVRAVLSVLPAMLSFPAKFHLNPGHTFSGLEFPLAPADCDIEFGQVRCAFTSSMSCIASATLPRRLLYTSPFSTTRSCSYPTRLLPFSN